MKKLREIERDVTGVFIFSADNKLLLGKAGVYSDAWVVPGGGIDEDETKEAAAVREVLEETGIDISGFELEQLDEVLKGASEKTLRETGERVHVNMRFYNFIVRLKQNADTIVLNTEDDFKEARWVSVKDLVNTTLSPPSVTTLKKLGYLK